VVTYSLLGSTCYSSRLSPEDPSILSTLPCTNQRYLLRHVWVYHRINWQRRCDVVKTHCFLSHRIERIWSRLGVPALRINGGLQNIGVSGRIWEFLRFQDFFLKENHWLQIKVFCSVGWLTYYYPATWPYEANTKGRFYLCRLAGFQGVLVSAGVRTTFFLRTAVLVIGFGVHLSISCWVFVSSYCTLG